MIKTLMLRKRIKQKPIHKYTLRHRFTATAIMAVVAVFAVAFIVGPSVVNADRFDEQIQELQQQNAQTQGTVRDLESQAASYQDAISKLQTQIDALQKLINDNLAQQAKLQAEIVAGEAELSRQRALLAADVKTMYVDGQPSTLEMLASSNDLSDFVDKEEYRTAVQTKIQATLAKIKELQRKLEKEKALVDQLLKEQQTQQAQQTAARAQQAQMLAYNESQQNEFNNKIKNNQKQIADLRRQQSVENARLSGGRVIGGAACDAGNGDTYPQPWCSAPIDSMIDSWGMYNRECVSYTAWKVYESGRHMPYWGGIGNANQWDDNARRAGIPVDTSPRDGDVAVKNSGVYGHVLYVEHVYADGSILVSDYNNQFDGVYRKYTVSKATIQANNLQFIHF
jgi:peptidoglycan DL-endopeptidase CwlO